MPSTAAAAASSADSSADSSAGALAADEPSSVADDADGYSIWVGLVYVFNLMVGTGALALPAALAGAGWALGGGALLALALLSFLSVTFVLETHATVNALRHRHLHLQQKSCEEEEEEEEEAAGTRGEVAAYGEGEEPLVSPTHTAPRAHYSLHQRVELGEMSQLLFDRPGRVLFYVTLCLYLYGDLSIYSAAVANSLKDVICTYRPEGWGNASRLADDERCWNNATSGASVTRGACYRAALLTFTVALAPFTCFDLQKSKYLQLLTTAMRWLAFGVMIWLGAARLVREGAATRVEAARWAGAPALLGTCVYAFMCHHSLPGLVSPVRRKRRLAALLALDYALVAAFYLLLALTGAFAFARPDPLYTLSLLGAGGPALDYFLALFPVFTLSASYPIVAVTLRSNLHALVGNVGNRGGVWARALLPLATVAPPLLLTLLVEDVGVLIDVTGSVAGVGIQYVIPAQLVVAARRRARATLPRGRNPHSSFLRHRAGPYLLLAWAALCVALAVARSVRQLQHYNQHS